MKTDVEVKEVKTGRVRKPSPLFKDVFFRLSHCARFGCIVGKRKTGRIEVLRWITSREEGRRFTQEASAHEYIMSHDDMNNLNRQMEGAVHLPMFEQHVDVIVHNAVEKLNSALESYRSEHPRDNRRYKELLREAESVDERIIAEVHRENPFSLN